MAVRNLQKKKMTVKVKKTPVLEERRQTGWAYNG
jgi:putative glutamine transport system permease protein